MSGALPLVLGAVLGILACNLLAFILKPVNLGLGGNSLTGMLAGGGMALAQYQIAPSVGFGLISSTFTAVAVMVLIGVYLNVRAR